MAEDRYAFLHVPDFAPGMSSYIRLGRSSDGFTWRDYTDGNRVTTTKGDKIEVIGGTYTLEIQCRGVAEAGFSSTEGDLRANSVTFKGSSKIDTVRKRGQLNVREVSLKGDVHTIYHGDVLEESYGEKLSSQTGTDAPHEILDAEGKGTGVDTVNPEIISRTWAKSIASYTGSEKRRVPTITEETWAEEISSKTHASSTSDDTTVEGLSSSRTEAESMKSITKVEKSTEDTTEAESTRSKTTATKIISETYADSDTKTYGNAESYTDGNSETIVAGIETTINYEMVNEVVLGMMNDVTVGAQATATGGGEVNVSIGAEASLSITASIEGRFGPRVEFGTADVKAFLDKTWAALTRKHVAAVHLIA